MKDPPRQSGFSLHVFLSVVSCFTGVILKEFYRQRKDLVFTGRTLLGAMPPKGQEMEDHYFGSLKPRVAAYMHDLDEELWKLGIPAKTKHNDHGNDEKGGGEARSGLPAA